MATKERYLVTNGSLQGPDISFLIEFYISSNKKTLGVCEEEKPLPMGSQPSLVFFPFLDAHILASMYTHLVIPNKENLRQVQDSRNTHTCLHRYTHTHIHTQSLPLSHTHNFHISIKRMEERTVGNKRLTSLSKGELANSVQHGPSTGRW